MRHGKFVSVAILLLMTSSLTAAYNSYITIYPDPACELSTGHITVSYSWGTYDDPVSGMFTTVNYGGDTYYPKMLSESYGSSSYTNGYIWTNPGTGSFTVYSPVIKMVVEL